MTYADALQNIFINKQKDGRTENKKGIATRLDIQ